MPREPEIPDGMLFTWESQVRQYPKKDKPGISYFRGEVDVAASDELTPDGLRAIFSTTVDCLLYRNNKGHVIGILNHYPTATEFEQTHNVNIWIRPDRKRRGIGRKLIEEALRRWPDINLEQQRYTSEGLAFARKLFPEADL